MQPRMACGLDRRADRPGFLVLVAALRPAATVAVLLVGRRSGRSLLPPRNGDRCLPRATFFRDRPRVPGPRHPPHRSHTQVHCLRPRLPIRLRRLSDVVSSKKHPPAIRRDRPPRQHRRGRAVHLDDEVPAVMPAAGAVPSREFPAQLGAIADWYNTCRPHTWLGGKTPDEVHYDRYPANRSPRFEPRACWPRGSRAQTWAIIKGKTGMRVELEVTYHAGRKHLPVVTLRRAAKTRTAQYGAPRCSCAPRVRRYVHVSRIVNDPLQTQREVAPRNRILRVFVWFRTPSFVGDGSSTIPAIKTRWTKTPGCCR